MVSRLLAVVALALVFAAGPAWAHSCPTHMKKIDAALATMPKLTEAQLADVMTWRKLGEEQHKAGKHDDSMATLAKAEALLGLK
ncbi:Signal peptide protein [uncultured Gammaproteobacteria bacterium]